MRISFKTTTSLDSIYESCLRNDMGWNTPDIDYSNNLCDKLHCDYVMELVDSSFPAASATVAVRLNTDKTIRSISVYTFADYVYHFDDRGNGEYEGAYRGFGEQNLLPEFDIIISPDTEVQSSWGNLRLADYASCQEQYVKFKDDNDLRGHYHVHPRVVFDCLKDNGFIFPDHFGKKYAFSYEDKREHTISQDEIDALYAEYYPEDGSNDDRDFGSELYNKIRACTEELEEQIGKKYQTHFLFS